MVFRTLEDRGGGAGGNAIKASGSSRRNAGCNDPCRVVTTGSPVAVLPEFDDDVLPRRARRRERAGIGGEDGAAINELRR